MRSEEERAYGIGETYCPVCGHRDSWGCGHDGRQRANARRHNASRAHLEERCGHYTDAPRPGWFPAEHSPEYVAWHALIERRKDES